MERAITSLESPMVCKVLLAIGLILLVVLGVQVLYIKTLIGKYSKDDYYKQLLVKNEYVEQQTQTMCSNFGVYGWQINTSLAKYINEPSMKAQLIHLIKLPAFFYSVPTKLGLQTVEFPTTDVYFIPLASTSPATERFVADVLANRVDYVTWQTGLFRSAYLANFKDKVTEFLEFKGFKNVVGMLNNVKVIALCKVPTLSMLKEFDYSFAQSIDETVPDTLIQSFIGDSRQELDIENLPVSLQVVGYKI